MKTDILAFGAHPDDVELSCSGTLMKHIANGKTVAIVDLTRGELGSRGTPEIRKAEAEKAGKIMGIAQRKILDLGDGHFENNESNRRKLIEMVRHFKPEIVLCNAVSDRHPDHGRASQLTSEACFYAGLVKIETSFEGKAQEAWRPKAVYHYVQDRFIEPDFVVDVSEFAEKKRECIMAYSSQFYNPASKEPQTPISSPEFLEALFAKMSIWGRAMNVRYAEGFTVERYPGVNDLFDLV